ncbi:MAG: DUF3078 domain-containing protein [Bacteroidales bacterium]|nr:DUF3078 domain-containing protein [Bacteroidales bacterium]MDD4822106.1 DUF3078 domain-containing protein [Bacteroidales bacterium]
MKRILQTLFALFLTGAMSTFAQDTLNYKNELPLSSPDSTVVDSIQLLQKEYESAKNSNALKPLLNMMANEVLRELKIAREDSIRLSAQKRHEDSINNPRMPYYIAMDRRADSLISIARQIFEVPADSLLDDTSFNPDTIIFNELFYPIVVMKDFVYDGKKLANFHDTFKVKVPSFSLPMPPNSLAYTYKDSLAQSALRYLILNHPELISYTEEMLTKGAIKTEVLPTKPTLADLSNLPPAVVTADKVSLKMKKPSYWNTKGKLNLNFSQAYLSDNWGGDNNVALYPDLRLDANYNDLKRITWENYLTYYLGFTTLPEKVNGRSYQIAPDELRLNSQLGLKAIARWSYTVTATLKTQTFQQYSGKNVVKAFLSPGYFDLSVGMRYRYQNKPGTFTITFNIDPLVYANRFVMDTAKVDQKRYGIRADRKSKETVNGLKITSDINWQIVKNISYVGRFLYRSPYDETYMELYNTFTFRVTSSFSPVLKINLIYNDARKRQPGENSYLQYQETLGFGFNFWW